MKRNDSYINNLTIGSKIIGSHQSTDFKKLLDIFLKLIGEHPVIDIWFIQEIRFVSQEQFTYINTILKQHNAQLRMHHFKDLTGFLIHSPHAKLKFNINEQEIYHTPHFEGRISILAITLITNENILLINNYLHSGDMDAQMTLLNAFTKYIANLKKNIPITI